MTDLPIPGRVRGRFAPSPTGRLHLGNARSALLGWLQARAAGGEFLLRIEDLDQGRCRPEYLESLYRDLEYLGLGWDETPLIQSQRGANYEEALERLRAAGRSYPCFCTRAEISRAASAPHGLSEEGPRYPGTCRELSSQEVEQRRAERTPALRFRTPPGEVSFVDAVHGPQRQDVDAVVGDFVVRKNDGVASYQLAVVVDDAVSAITHVLRGDDLLSSTARQIQLYQTQGWRPPLFAHVPLLIGHDGKRMAKREGASAVGELREARVPAERVIGLLASWSGLGDGSPISAAELAGEFSLERIPRAPVMVSEEEIRGRLGI
ncbi:MAG: tRNA glutamyl-Q(34) synthetase GluQRS [Myxococcota bacterium]|nr:tRNA glutamyl-Q(34) synthetase GluQRS [Myxococcota bacterium]